MHSKCWFRGAAVIMSMTRRWGTGEAGGGHIWAAWRVACWSGGWHHDAGSNLTCGLEVLIWTADKGDGVICRGDIEGLFEFGVSILAFTQTVAKLPPPTRSSTPCSSKYYYWTSSSRKHGDPWLIVDMAVVDFFGPWRRCRQRLQILAFEKGLWFGSAVMLLAEGVGKNRLGGERRRS